jgi:DNA polymerase V
MDEEIFYNSAYTGTKQYHQNDVKTANASGFGAAADDFMERGIDLNEQLINNKPATYFFKMNSNAMIGASIDVGDILIVDRSLKAVNGKMLDHSKAKVDLLSTYLEKYLNIISNDGYTHKISVFDLFCGEGIYENEGEGSPIATLRVLKDLHFINKAKNKNIPKVDLFFNDLDEQKIQKLKSIIEKKKPHWYVWVKIQGVMKTYTHLHS